MEGSHDSPDLKISQKLNRRADYYTATLDNFKTFTTFWAI